ncbi:hypothetical protein AG1IA_00662 [Rhizoctonia solani AG-1 IA]|uniref:Uncharacterized protein n=1 Tax=Thanatephorus cucumeris (strain AG1-IA) TaxID=983506 RepID=L8X8C8_THACA|nr:hypothetical protein AG1IA_00662 [Rhizoctonia solani AG-1 IA]
MIPVLEGPRTISQSSDAPRTIAPVSRAWTPHAARELGYALPPA